MTTEERKRRDNREPRRAGEIWRCGYWGTPYRVEAVALHSDGSLDSITVTYLDTGTTTTHGTPLDARPAYRDIPLAEAVTP